MTLDPAHWQQCITSSPTHLSLRMPEVTTFHGARNAYKPREDPSDGGRCPNAPARPRSRFYSLGNPAALPDLQLRRIAEDRELPE